MEFLQKTLVDDFGYEDDFVVETALRENLAELRSGRLHTAGPPPDSELPQKPFGLLNTPSKEQEMLVGLRVPVEEKEKELHRNSLRREIVNGIDSLANNSYDSIQTPITARRHGSESEAMNQAQLNEGRSRRLQTRTGQELKVPRARPASADHVVGSRVEENRLSAFVNISDFQNQSVSHSSSSLGQDFSQSRTSVSHGSGGTSGPNGNSYSKSRSSSQKRQSKTSSCLNTTGSSKALDSSFESNKEESSRIHGDECKENYSKTYEKAKDYYDGEAPELKEILAKVTEGNIIENDVCNHQIGAISPHSGEVVRIKVPFNQTEEVPGQFLSAENIQRLVDQQISPSYNGHKVTIQVNRSSEALAMASTVDRRTRQKSSKRQRKVSYSGDFSSIRHELDSEQPVRTNSVQALSRDRETFF